MIEKGRLMNTKRWGAKEDGRVNEEGEEARVMR